MIDETHLASRRSWIESANGHPEFPIQNLPLAVFSTQDTAPRGGIAIGDTVLDLAAMLANNLFTGDAKQAAEAASGSRLNDFLELGSFHRKALRRQVSRILDAGGPARADMEPLRSRFVVPAADCALHLPATIGDYTDFYAGIHHATNAGRLFRPDNPLLPNYKHMPIAYHGRSSTLGISGEPVRRPRGQRKPAGDAMPSFAPAANLDYELELGIWIGPGNRQGEPIAIAGAADHIAGYCLLNDWSARDIQAWEAQPLGPFLAKNFATTISPWIVTPEALAPFRAQSPARAETDPTPLPYLRDAGDQAAGSLDIELEVLLLTPKMKAAGVAAQRLSRTNATNLYWTPAQFVTHHSSGGCRLQSGDLFGSGTISSPAPDGFGSLLEITSGGKNPISLGSGEIRHYLADGDEVIFRAHARRDGFASIGFGECRAEILPSLV
jgi:fumarylacetoacetase